MIERRTLVTGLGALWLGGCANRGASSGASEAATGGDARPAQTTASARTCDGSGRFSVTVRGSGPDVVLVPGLVSSTEPFEATAARLEASHRVHLVQVAGFAGTPIGANAGPGPHLPGLVRALSDYIGCVGGPVSLIGHSMGGLTGLILAADAPQRLSRLMIVDALPFFSVLIDPNATPASIRPMAEGTASFILAQPDAAFRAGQERTIRTLVKNPDWQGRALEASLTSDRGLMAALTAEVMQTDMRPRLAAITVPTTVLYAYDTAMPAPPAAVERLYQTNYASLPGVRLERIDNALHFIMVDQPEAFAAAVDRFLSVT